MSKYDYDDYDDDLADKFEERRSRKKKKKRWNPNAKWGIALIIELIIIMGLGYGIVRVYLHDKYQKFDHVNDMKEEELEKLQAESVKSIRTASARRISFFALFFMVVCSPLIYSSTKKQLIGRVPKDCPAASETFMRFISKCQNQTLIIVKKCRISRIVVRTRSKKDASLLLNPSSGTHTA